MTDQLPPFVARIEADRRRAPRREADAAVHYAEQALVAAAVAHVDAGYSPATRHALAAAVGTFRGTVAVSSGPASFAEAWAEIASTLLDLPVLVRAVPAGMLIVADAGLGLIDYGVTMVAAARLLAGLGWAPVTITECQACGYALDDADPGSCPARSDRGHDWGALGRSAGAVLFTRCPS